MSAEEFTTQELKGSERQRVEENSVLCYHSHK
jgi:hypothetical protein